MQETYIKIHAPEYNEELDEIREEGLLFENIASALCVPRDCIAEIDEVNYLSEIKNIQDKYSK